jgi:Raf kinase inhibitor-like YbhB/YbcL family protein
VQGGPHGFTFTTPAYASLEPDGGGGDGGPTIPAIDTCAYSDAGGYGVSPELDWSGAPAATQSYAIVLHDLTNGFYHWAIWDIPASTMSLPAGLPRGAALTMPAGAMQTGFMGPQFAGPCPAGSLHVYQFEIYALGTATLQVNGGASAQQVATAANKAPLATALLTGLSNAKHY